jgi:hypothetical protein
MASSTVIQEVFIVEIFYSKLCIFVQRKYCLEFSSHVTPPRDSIYNLVIQFEARGYVGDICMMDHLCYPAVHILDVDVEA